MSRTSPAIEDYLKGIYTLETEGGDPLVSTKAVADRMNVSAASATNMLKRLGDMKLVSYVPYRGGALTEAGRKIALEVIRHHRLLETYLSEALGVPWDAVHQEAEILEHVLSEDLEDRISALLGHPTFDPHGHPIPSKDGTMPPASERTLWDVGDGEPAAIERVRDSDAEALRYLDSLGMRPGAALEVVGRGPVGGPLMIKVGGEQHAISRELAEAVWVS
jgi:DtxR family transcriptional regulator, Mn-dependent transcriptional regulator